MARRSPLLLVALGAVVGALVLIVVSEPDTSSLRNQLADLFGYGGPHSDIPGHGRDLFHTEVDISGSRGGLTYAEYDARRDRGAVNGFFGFGCPDKCEGQVAGFKWASKHGILNPSDCPGLRWDFVEGCAAYVLKRD